MNRPLHYSVMAGVLRQEYVMPSHCPCVHAGVEAIDHFVPVIGFLRYRKIVEEHKHYAILPMSSDARRYSLQVTKTTGRSKESVPKWLCVAGI
jgi:hypothetical protein